MEHTKKMMERIGQKGKTWMGEKGV